MQQFTKPKHRTTQPVRVVTKVRGCPGHAQERSAATHAHLTCFKRIVCRVGGQWQQVGAKGGFWALGGGGPAQASSIAARNHEYLNNIQSDNASHVSILAWWMRRDRPRLLQFGSQSTVECFYTSCAVDRKCALTPLRHEGFTYGRYQVSFGH